MLYGKLSRELLNNRGQIEVLWNCDREKRDELVLHKQRRNLFQIVLADRMTMQQMRCEIRFIDEFHKVEQIDLIVRQLLPFDISVSYLLLTNDILFQGGTFRKSIFFKPSSLFCLYYILEKKNLNSLYLLSFHNSERIRHYHNYLSTCLTVWYVYKNFAFASISLSELAETFMSCM